MANNDPILTPIFVSYGVTGALTIGTATISYASILSTIVITASSIALSLLLAPRPPRPGDGSVVFKQPMPERNYGVGTCRIGGKALFFAEQDGDLHVVAAWLDGKYSELLEFYLHDDLVTLNTVTTIGVDGTSGFVDPGEDGRYVFNNLKFQVNHGVSGQPIFPDLVAAFPGEVEETFTATGISCTYLYCAGVDSEDQPSFYPNGKPEPSVVADLIAVYDPRDEEQDVDDPSTWVFSKNLALCWLWYECFCANGPQRNYATAILPVLDAWIEEADICDEMVADKNDVEAPRYEINYWWQSSTTAETVRAMFIACCDGWLFERPDGAIIIRVGKYREPTVTITDDAITGYYTQRDQPIEDRLNELIIKFTSPEQEYGEVESDPFRDEDAQAEDRRVLTRSLDLWGIHRLNHARRIGSRAWISQNEELRGSLTLNFRGLQVLGERWIRVQSSRVRRLADEVLEVRGLTLDAVEGSLTLEYIRSGSFIDDYDAADPDWGDGDDPPVSGKPSSISAPIPQNVTAEAFVDPIRIDVSWDDSITAPPDLSFAVRHRLADPPDEPWLPNEIFDDLVSDAGRFTATIYPTTEEVYEVQVASIGSGGGFSQWSVSAFTE